MLAMPLAADHRFTRFRYVVRDAESEISIVLDWHKLHGNVSAAHPDFQQATPTGIAAIHGEAAWCLQSLD